MCQLYIQCVSNSAISLVSAFNIRNAYRRRWEPCLPYAVSFEQLSMCLSNEFRMHNLMLAPNKSYVIFLFVEIKFFLFSSRCVFWSTRNGKNDDKQLIQAELKLIKLDWRRIRLSCLLYRTCLSFVLSFSHTKDS